MPLIDLATDDSDWIVLPLATGWTQFDTVTGIYLPRYRRQGGIVFVTGCVRATASNASSSYILVANLPENFRPNQIHQATQQKDSGVGFIQVHTNGSINMIGPVTINTTAIWLNYCFSL